MGELTIRDPDVIATSGSDVHPALVATGDEELAAADRYERVSYRRVAVSLVSGRTAWAYVPKDLADVR